MHGGGVQSTILELSPYSPRTSLLHNQLLCTVYNCLVINIECRLALHAIILMGGAAASETLIGGYIWTIGGCSTPQRQPRENTGTTGAHTVEGVANHFKDLCVARCIHA